MRTFSGRLGRWVALLLALAALLVSTAPAAPDESAVRDWITTHAIQLKTPEAGHGFADLQPLKQVIGSARIVSLGEATHGTREFFQLKHRLLEFLASEMGFTIFSIETNLPEAYRLNDFVLTGAGDPARLLKGMYFWTWNTEEVLAMIHWMRDFNRAGRGPLHFTGFDMQTPTVAAEIVRQFVEKYNTGHTAEMKRAAEMALASSRARSGFGTATARFPVEAAAGKRVRFSGHIKTERVSSYAGLWWRVDGPEGVKGFANLGSRAPKGTTDWKRYELEISVAPGATNISFGLLLSGDGTAWFDAVEIALDGQAFTDPARFDFGFESAAVKGFSTGSPGYSIRLDRQVVHQGSQSLRLRAEGPAPAANQNDPQAAVAAWRNVVRQLADSREACLGQGATVRDHEWAVQNARVVLQCMQMRTNEVSRDRSMADNVQWILEQNPGAKIVLWAHNGHVSTGGFRGYTSMGTTLRQMYGDQMVVVGFAFSEGSFQAVETGKGLRQFTVAPAPEGTLDAMFAATGIPLFALDLRRLPQSGCVADWFGRPQRTRSIGASYSEGTAASYFSNLTAPAKFDVLLFVNQTTAARANPPLP